MKHAVLVAGVCGRMGGRVAELIARDPELALVGGIEKTGRCGTGVVVCPAGNEVTVTEGFANNVPNAELLVEFTSPEGTMSAVEFCTKRGIALVSGTTGQSEANLKAMRDASRKIPLLFSPNMSIGVTLLARTLPKMVDSLGGRCDIELIEKHHRAKKDSPSGSALMLARAIAGASRLGEKSHVRYGRGQGISDRQTNEIFVHSIRAGDIIGEHTVLLALGGERIEIKHVAESRDCFAYGTLAAIKFLLGKKPGWYTMEDVVGLPDV